MIVFIKFINEKNNEFGRNWTYIVRTDLSKDSLERKIRDKIDEYLDIFTPPESDPFNVNLYEWVLTELEKDGILTVLEEDWYDLDIDVWEDSTYPYRC